LVSGKFNEMDSVIAVCGQTKMLSLSTKTIGRISEGRRHKFSQFSQ